MQLNEYQEKAKETAEYPNKNSFNGLIYTVIGLSGEVGELNNKLKKIIRGDWSSNYTEGYETVYQELLDVFWYVSAVASELNVTLEQVAQDNLSKLSDRKNRGVIKGNGDNR